MIKVFIVDDSALVRERLVDMLSGFSEVEVTGEAGDPGEAIDGISRLSPDVVILDIRLPRGSGIDLLPDIKKAESAPVVIILTNYPYPQYREKCMDAGADYFLNKSTEFEKIGEVLRELVQDDQTQRTESSGKKSKGGFEKSDALEKEHKTN